MAVLLTLSCGAALTFNVALAVLPVPPLVELTTDVVLRYVPVFAAVTFKDSVQVPFTASVPPLSDTLAEPAVAVAVRRRY